MAQPGVDCKLSAWLSENTYHHTDFTIAGLASVVRSKQLKVTVIIPAREVADSIGGVLNETVKPLVDGHVVHSVFAIDANSIDNTGAVAAANGAHVLQRAEIAPELGKSLGKGDALWRALLATTAKSDDAHEEIVAFLDGDTKDPSIAHLIGIIGPLIINDSLQLVKGCFDRPFKSPSGDVQPHNGGRVTELVARPLLNLHFPQLAAFRQPLAGEFAARRVLLERLPFPVGYGIEIGTLIDSFRLVGLDKLAECDLGTRQNEHKSLRDLSPMAFAVMGTAERRLRPAGVKNGQSISDKIYLPWERKHQEVSCVERRPIQDQLDHLHPRKRKLPRPPFVDVPGVRNFRDIGGYPVRNGKSVRTDLVFRSGDLKDMTYLGTQQLDALGIMALFDVRSAKEVDKGRLVGGEEELDVWTMLGSPKRVFVPIFKDEDFSPEAMAIRFKDYSSEGTEGFERAYRNILLGCGPAITAIIDHLTEDVETPSPILIHCSAGKDRTGVLVMLLLSLAGCSKATIAEEYHLSEAGLGPEWKADAVGRLKELPVFQGKDGGGVERMVGARKEVMLAVLKRVKREWGGAENFLKSQIGISPLKLEICKDVLREE